MTIGRWVLLAAALSLTVLPGLAEAHGRRHHRVYRQYVETCVDVDGFPRPCRPWWQRLGHGDPAFLPVHSFRAARGGW